MQLKADFLRDDDDYASTNDPLTDSTNADSELKDSGIDPELLKVVQARSRNKVGICMDAFGGPKA